ncbi:hypothetical protein PSTT_06916, partial [Puccinia striiformis]
MELVGSLSIGHTNSLVSCAIYNRNRVIMTVCDIQLSAWLTVRSAREGIHTFLKSQIKTETSPFGKPCFSLSIQGILSQQFILYIFFLELIHFVFFVKGLGQPLGEPTSGVLSRKNGWTYYKFSQSKKWLEELAPQHRAQMCEVDEEHYYLFEPVELASGLLVVPIFFYSQESQIYSKCIAPQIKGFMKDNKLVTKIKIPQDIKFDHPDLYTIHTIQFKKSYAKIQFNGYKLSEECADALYEHDGKGNQKKIQLPDPWQYQTGPRIGSVQSLWEYHSRSRSKFYIHFNEFNELYSMREVSRTRTKQYVNVNEIEACINVQHNCDKGNCPIRRPSHHSLNIWSNAVEGLENWGRNHFVFENPYAAADDKMMMEKKKMI